MSDNEPLDSLPIFVLPFSMKMKLLRGSPVLCIIVKPMMVLLFSSLLLIYEHIFNGLTVSYFHLKYLLSYHNYCLLIQKSNIKCRESIYDITFYECMQSFRTNS